VDIIDAYGLYRPPGPLPDAGDLAHKIVEIYLLDKISAIKEHIAIELDPKILDSYIGKYKWINTSKGWIEASGEVFTLYKKNNQLFGKGKVGDIEIIAEGENRFYMKDNSTLKFLKEKGKVTGIVFDAMGLGVVIVEAQKLN
jgi:hypothetical protein